MYRPVFVASTQIYLTVLPTYENIMKHYLYVLKCYNKISKSLFTEVVSKELNVKSVWAKACLPILSDHRIFKMLKDYHGKFSILQVNVILNQIYL